MSAAGTARVSPALLGYCDRLDARPGESVDVHVHGDGPVTIDLVALRGADLRVPSASPLEVPVAAVAPIAATAVAQVSHPGSFALVERIEALGGATALRIVLWLYPTLPASGTVQGIVSTVVAGSDGIALVLSADGHIELRQGASGAIAACRSARPLPARSWTHVTASLSATASHLRLAGDGWAPSHVAGEGLALAGASSLAIGAAAIDRDWRGAPFGIGCFNGKIEGPSIQGGTTPATPPIAAWDFADGIDTDRIVDVSGNGHHGRLYNAPARGVTGQAWRGDEIDFRRAPAHYAAIHFHEDDLEDAGWRPTARMALPGDLASGVYAVRVVSAGAEERIPLFVMPQRDAAKQAIAFLAPTFTYQAYGNASLGERIDYRGSGLTSREITPGARDAQLAGHPVLRGSLYDVHRDGSGRFHSSLRRPILNFRPDYVSPIQQAPRHLGADLYLTGWLARRGHRFDVLTDHAIDAEGSLLDGYRVLVTGTHPEYWSGRMLDALEAFIAGGGRVMYLGGNGFYWVTAQDPARPHVIECRRGYAGLRTWTSEPGEVHLAATGEMGGLWRHRGRAPNRLVGIGMASQGWDERAPGFRRSAASHAPDCAWVFAGVPGETFGEDGLVMGGASGDEVDRYDAALGSPRDARVLATSMPHSTYYKIAVEDVPMVVEGLGGDRDDRVRSDVVLFERPSGGAVFSVGAISWAGAMAFNDFDNPVERITRNVLDRFLDPQPLNLTRED